MSGCAQADAWFAKTIQIDWSVKYETGSGCLFGSPCGAGRAGTGAAKWSLSYFAVELETPATMIASWWARES
ncbi:hypothetical protein SBA4_3400007 [Candidatus Sulfopaludibacter sp. SbA4]|nr:hypothetical protein SBA4_3400007 [Candidatus Sulfopaludibacter sp. SbA4]